MSVDRIGFDSLKSIAKVMPQSLEGLDEVFFKWLMFRVLHQLCEDPIGIQRLSRIEILVGQGEGLGGIGDDLALLERSR